MRDIRSRFFLRSLAACALALAVGAPHFQAAAHAAAHAIERTQVHLHDGTTHSHGHDGDMHHHDSSDADASPAALRAAASVSRPRGGDGLTAAALGSAVAAPVPGGLTAIGASPPPRHPSLLLWRRLADRAPPA